MLLIKVNLKIPRRKACRFDTGPASFLRIDVNRRLFFCLKLRFDAGFERFSVTQGLSTSVQKLVHGGVGGPFCLCTNKHAPKQYSDSCSQVC